MNTLRNPISRLNYKQDLDLGLNTRKLVQCLQYSILIPLSGSTREKRKGPEVLKKEGNICYIKLLEDNFSLKGTIKWLRKGER